MKKRIAITLIVAALLSLAGTVEARDAWRGHKDGHHRDYTPVHYRNKHHRGRHHRSDHHYRSRHAHYRGRHHGHHALRDGIKIAAGALILGSVVRSINDHGSRQIVYQASRPGTDRWYRIDQDGQCVEVRLNRYGEEVWSYTDAGRCY